MAMGWNEDKRRMNDAARCKKSPKESSFRTKPLPVLVSWQMKLQLFFYRPKINLIQHLFFSSSTPFTFQTRAQGEQALP